jgi:SWIM zinc finger
MDAREERGRAIAERSRIEPNGAGWLVPSQTGNGKYLVCLKGGEPHCTCPDYETRQSRCKHGWAVIITMSRVEQNADGSTTVSTVTVKAERKTYAQPDWPAYHAHQVNERRHFLALLADLCATIPDRAASPKGGRPPIPMRDAIFSAVFKCYSLTSARRFSGELAEAHEQGFISRCPHFSTVLDSSQQMRKWWRAVQNMPLLLAACSGTVCNTSQCSTTLPTSSSRKMSMPAQSGPPGHTWCVWRTT